MYSNYEKMQQTQGGKMTTTPKRIISGYGDNLSLLPLNDSDDWSIRFSYPDRPLHNLQAETVIALKNMYALHKEPINLLYSGGIDSEYIAYSLLAARIPCNLVTFQFKDLLNNHDISYVEKFKKKNAALTYESRVIDIEDFFNSGEAFEYAEKTKATLPHILPLMKMIDLLAERVLVIAAGEPFLIPHNGRWCLRERESVAALWRFGELKKINGSVSFLQHTPEIFFSYLADPIYQQLCSGGRPGKQHSLTSRIDIYNNGYELENRVKYHGYEKLQLLLGAMEEELKKRYPLHTREAYFDYFDLLARAGVSN